jgi:hypothetical protein
MGCVDTKNSVRIKRQINIERVFQNTLGETRRGCVLRNFVAHSPISQ